jgi:hypothetical protein
VSAGSAGAGLYFDGGGLGHFYTEREFAEIARRAGLLDVAVRGDHGGQLFTGPA